MTFDHVRVLRHEAADGADAAGGHGLQHDMAANKPLLITHSCVMFGFCQCKGLNSVLTSVVVKRGDAVTTNQ